MTEKSKMNTREIRLREALDAHEARRAVPPHMGPYHFEKEARALERARLACKAYLGMPEETSISNHALLTAMVADRTA